MQVVTAEEMRRLDRLTIERGTAGLVLMERAGTGVTHALLAEFRRECARPGGVVVVAGRGNNGGDGFVIARLLKRRRIRVQVVLIGARARVAGDARANLERWCRAKGMLHELSPGEVEKRLPKLLAPAGVIVDALLGTGLNADVTGPLAAAIEAMNRARDGRGRRPAVVAVDIPSGLDADRGEPRGVAVHADRTVTLGAVKVGLMLPVARAYVGELSTVDIGIAREALAQVQPLAEAADRELVARLVPRRRVDAHKGSSGHLLIVAGSRGKSGAAILAGRGALRGGAGLVTVACPAVVQPWIAGGAAELMTAAVGGGGDFLRGTRGDQPSLAAEWAEQLQGKDALAIGPGIGGHGETVALVHWLVAHVDLPMVIDADGLNAVASNRDVLRSARRGVVLTPHPGEMARLTGRTITEIQTDRPGAARALARELDAVVVLKGSGTVTAAPDGRWTVNLSGGPGLGSGGTGDVLAGLIGSLLAQGLEPYDAARLGVYLHGRAGDRVSERIGDAGLLASEVADELPLARREL